MGMDIVDTILAERRANRIAAAVDKSEYWQSNYEALLDKYNALVRKYDHDIAEGHAECQSLIELMKEHEADLPFTKEEVNQRLEDARNKSAEKFPL